MGTVTDSSGAVVTKKQKSWSRTSIAVRILRPLEKAVSIPVNLDVQQRSVEVTSAAPPLETETSELGQVVDNERVASLPLNGRNFAQLALLTAGTAPSEPGSRGRRRLRLLRQWSPLSAK